MIDKNLPLNVPEIEYTYISRNIINKKQLNLEFAMHSLGTDDRIEPEQKLQELQDLKQCCRDTFCHENWGDNVGWNSKSTSFLFWNVWRVKEEESS